MPFNDELELPGQVVAKSIRSKKYLIECNRKQYVAFQITDSHKLNVGDEIKGALGAIETIGEHILEDQMGQRFRAQIGVITRNELEALHWTNT